jgi:cytochrome d ubiquinol oxidase subunit II
VFALGTVVGGIASRRVPVGNAAGSLVSSWLNPTSIFLGVLAVTVAAFLAAAYLAADAERLADLNLERRFRLRALGAGIATGGIALGGLVVVHADAPPLYEGLVGGAGLAGLICSALAALVTLALVWWRRFGPARYTAALAVAAIIAGWALAQRPVSLPGLTVAAAAAPRDTLITVVVAVLAGAIILFPSLGLLFHLVLRGRFDPDTSAAQPALVAPTGCRAGRPRLLARVAGACLVAGVGLLTVAEAGWAHAAGAVCLLGAIASGFLAATPAVIADERSGLRREELADG